MLSHSFFIAGFVVCASEWSESIYSARGLQLKELLLTDVPQTKLSAFWLTENAIISLGLSLAYHTLRHVTTRVHLFGLANKVVNEFKGRYDHCSFNCNSSNNCLNCN